MEERVIVESGQTQTGPQTAACLLLVWTALLKGPVPCSRLLRLERATLVGGGTGLRGWALALALPLPPGTTSLYASVSPSLLIYPVSQTSP